MNDYDTSHDISIYSLGTRSPLSKGCYEFSNVSMQDKFVDRKLSTTSEEMEKEKIGEKEEKLGFVKKLNIIKLGEEEELQSVGE